MEGSSDPKMILYLIMQLQFGFTEQWLHMSEFDMFAENHIGIIERKLIDMVVEHTFGISSPFSS